MTKDMRNILDAITWNHQEPDAVVEKTPEILKESAEGSDRHDLIRGLDETVRAARAKRNPLEEAVRAEYEAFMEDIDDDTDDSEDGDSEDSVDGGGDTGEDTTSDDGDDSSDAVEESCLEPFTSREAHLEKSKAARQSKSYSRMGDKKRDDQKKTN